MEARESDDGTISCRTDPAAETYVPGMKKTGANGLTFILQNADPNPPSRGSNTWTVRLEKNGVAQTGAMIDVTPWMPKHGHGTTAVPVVMPMNDAYTIAPLYFFMVGLWQTTIKATAGGITDQAVFTFCVDG